MKHLLKAIIIFFLGVIALQILAFAIATDFTFTIKGKLVETNRTHWETRGEYKVNQTIGGGKGKYRMLLDNKTYWEVDDINLPLGAESVWVEPNIEGNSQYTHMFIYRVSRDLPGTVGTIYAKPCYENLYDY